MEAQWRIQLLGGLRAVQGDREITRFRTQKTGALLAYLAYYHERAHPREVLIDLLWPETDPVRGRQSLSMALSSLRHQLEPPGAPAGTILRADRLSLQVNPAAVTTDVAAFEAALQAARAPSASERLPHLEEAVARYPGALLPGYYEAWVLPEQQRLGELYFQAIRELIREREAAGALDAAIELACRAVSADWLREEAHAELIRLYAAAGQPGAALRQFRELERLQQQELGQSPSAATRALVRSIEARLSEPVPELLSAAPAPPHPRALAAGYIPRELPRGTVTFLPTDIEGWTAAYERLGEAFKASLARHHALLRRAFEQHGGYEIKEAGDGFLVAFQSAGDALACALAGQRSLAAEAWPEPMDPLQVRMALHTGEVELEKGEYRGLVLHHASRLGEAAHGGQILCSEITANLLRRDVLWGVETGLQLADLGVYRLRDLSSPERLFQVNYAGMPQREFPPPNAAGYASSLPLQFTHFFGRGEELDRLQAMLQPVPTTGRGTPMTGCRLVTMTGPGGSGKTRLALALAERLLEPFHGAVWFVPLAALAAPERILDAVRDTLHLPRSPDVEPLEQIVNALSGHPTLLLLDNFEHLVAAGAPVVRTLLERVPDLTCLLTSRQRLNLAAERDFPVPPLPIPASLGTPEQLVDCESVQLFVDRAQAVRPDFQVTNANAAAVAEICRRLEGIPLALELAAARASVLTPAQILAHLEDRLGFLVSRRRDAEERHRTLRACLDWSYQLLSPELQRFFRRLAVFRGGWSLEAAEAVGVEDDPELPGPALDLLEQLRECSLVEVVEAGEEVRYRLLETVRQYARDRLREAGEEEAVQDRHVDFFLRLSEQAEPGLRGPEQVVWLGRIEVEHDNLRAALGWTKAMERAQAGLRIAGALWSFWSMRGYSAEELERLTGLLAMEEPVGPTAVRAKALLGAGWLANDQMDHEAARRLFEESLAIYRKLEDELGMANALRSLGIMIGVIEGKWASSQALVEEGLALCRKRGDRLGIADALRSLGYVARRQGDCEAGQVLVMESLSLYRELNDTRMLGWALYELGGLVRDQGDDNAARAFLQESVAIRRKLGDKGGLAFSLRALGYVSYRQRDFAAARACFEESMTIEPGAGFTSRIAAPLCYLGHVARHEGDHDLARSLYQKSLVMQRELDAKLCISSCLVGLAGLAGAEGQHGQAVRLLGAAAALREPIIRSRHSDRLDYDIQVAAARTALGEEAFSAAWEEGRAMALEQAVCVALEECEIPIPDRKGA